MEVIKTFLDFFLHLDDHLRDIILKYENWTYLILFAIIFVETGLVIWPFLPGDSLLFAAGSFAAAGMLNLAYLLVLLFVAAFLGDTVNYLIGKYFGEKILSLKFRGKPLVKPKYMEKTHAFYEKHGPKTIILARFVPIVRTFAPFVAGIGTMNYRKFISYNLIGGFIWVVGITLLGYFFGTIPIVKENFELVVLGIIGLSVLPIIFEFVRGYFGKKSAA
ncbi:MAG: DedA family protein [Bacteroidia bacterium]|nr:DedA family protein [Bacteroidia bacterium]